MSLNNARVEGKPRLGLDALLFGKYLLLRKGKRSYAVTEVV
jgi:hypothetical protein